jgi:hypothetical protein
MLEEEMDMLSSDERDVLQLAFCMKWVPYVDDSSLQ